MKTVYLTGSDNQLIDDLSKLIGQTFSAHLEVVGEQTYSEDILQDCNFAQPEFLVCDYIDKDSATKYLEICPNSTIVLISTDTNRANSLVTEINKSGYYNVITLNRETTSLSNLCELLVNHNAQLEDAPKVEKVATPQVELPKETLENIERAKQNMDSDIMPLEELNKMLENGTSEEDLKRQKEEVEKLNREAASKRQEESEEITTLTSTNISLANFKSKTIAVFSKKGGTGKTTIAKELANVYSSVKLPRKLSNGSQYLKTIVVDMDFESGNLRTYLGIDNPAPNIYMWINDILDKLEDGMSLDKIYYSPMAVMQNYSILLNNNYRVLPTDQGDFSPRVISRIINQDTDGTLLPKILYLIIKSLKRTFDVVIIDCGTSYDDLAQVILEQADDIVYPLLPNIADIENFKVFNDDIKTNDRIAPQKIKIVMNQYIKKIRFTEEFNNVLRLVKYQAINPETNRKQDYSYSSLLRIPYTLNTQNFNNNIVHSAFITTNGSAGEKQPYLKLAQIILPIFKVKVSNEQLEKYKRQQALKEKQRLKAKKTKALQKAPVNITPKVETSPQETVETVQPEMVQGEKQRGLVEYLKSDLSFETYNAFVENLKKFAEIKCMRSGFPIYDGKKPPSLSSAVYKTYTKNYKKEIANVLKAKKK